MTEREIQLLGFEKESLDPIQCLDDTGKAWVEEAGYYYAYRVTQGLDFISCANDDTEDGEWYVDVFNTDIPIRFYKFEEVQALINMLEKHIIK